MYFAKDIFSLNMFYFVEMRKLHTERVLTELLMVEKDFNEILDAEGLDVWN